jgi:hypothetical protein
MPKRVKVSIELSSSFVRLLQASVELHGLLKRGVKLDPKQALAVVVLGEAKGLLPEEVEDSIPTDYLGELRVLHDERIVTEDPPSGR